MSSLAQLTPAQPNRARRLDVGQLPGGGRSADPRLRPDPGRRAPDRPAASRCWTWPAARATSPFRPPPPARRSPAVDIAPALLERGAANAWAAGVEVTWLEGDAEALPFDDASFDVVTSAVGVMFCASHERAAAELLRVCRPGGSIGLINWTPEGLIGSHVRRPRPVHAAVPRRAPSRARSGAPSST